MAETLTSETLADARSAAAKLSDDCSSPREVESNMDILSSALVKLVPNRGKAGEPMPKLCEMIKRFVKRKLLEENSLTCCQGIEDLIQVSDYDISDEVEFEEEVEAEISVLQEDLENAFAILEKRLDRTKE